MKLRDGAFVFNGSRVCVVNRRLARAGIQRYTELNAGSG